jgi:UDP-glucose 4-epimerase
MMSNILITGGLGYIGSHTVLSLLKDPQCRIIIVDDCSNSSLETLNTIEYLSKQQITFYQVDVRNYSKMHEIFYKEKIDAVIHFAAAKSVSESIKNPEFYYQNNITVLMVLLDVMRYSGVKKMIFSSSATVYSPSNNFPVSEECELGYLNPYGQTKLISEDILIREHRQQALDVCILRYFNPIGNDVSGTLGDRWLLSATNIMPMILKALHQKKPFYIYGKDYQTKDGSPVRDYIHVCDLADAHRLSYAFLTNHNGCHIMNVGLGVGVSVFELISTFNEVNQVNIPIEYLGRRDGDLPICYANADKIKSHLSWRPQFNLPDMCRDAYAFYKQTIRNV